MIVVALSTIFSLVLGIYLVASKKLEVGDESDAIFQVIAFTIAGFVAGLLLGFMLGIFIDYELRETDTATLLPIRDGSDDYVETYRDESGDTYYLVHLSNKEGGSEYQLVLVTEIVYLNPGIEDRPRISTYDYRPTAANYWVYTFFVDTVTDQVVISIPSGGVSSTTIPLYALDLS